MPVVYYCNVCGKPIKVIFKPDGTTVLGCDCNRDFEWRDIDRLTRAKEIEPKVEEKEGK